MDRWITRHRTPARLAVLNGFGRLGRPGRTTHGLVAAGLEVWGMSANPELEQGYRAAGACGFICAGVLDVLADRALMSRFDAVTIPLPQPQLKAPVRALLIPLRIPYAIGNTGEARSYRWGRQLIERAA